MTSTHGRSPRSLVSRLLMLALAAVLAGCATRPGAEMLTPVASDVPDAKLVTVYAATTRERERDGVNVFTTGRAQDLNYGMFTISVPPNHQPGQIEWPEGQPDPGSSFATVSQSVLNEKTFTDRIATTSTGEHKRDVGIFVHGYNYNFQEALFRLAQMSADANLDGAPILFAWPSQAAVAGYVADKDSVTYSRDYLADMLTALAKDRRIGNITLFGHSMGAWLTVEALRQLRLTGQDAVIDRLNVVLAAPDIDVDVFRAQMEVLGPLSPPLTVLVSTDDRALAVSNRLSGARPRLGALDITDPRVQGAAREANVTIVDISSVEASDGLNHDRYISLATFYPELAETDPDGAGQSLRRAGAFVFNAVGATISSPFNIVGEALAGE